jgi:hypothetical protein
MEETVTDKTKIINRDHLLTPKQVAELLQISIRTVYDNADRLGGFYPAGIRVLRFKPEIIHNIMEGPEGLQCKRVQGRRRKEKDAGRTQAAHKIPKTNPERWGL